MAWHHPASPQKKFKEGWAVPSAGKVTATVFWDAEGMLLVDIAPRSQTFNSDLYIPTLKTLHKRFSRVRPQKNC
jgi:hypothetical protein